MPTIFDNIRNILASGLNSYLQNVNRADFCVGYFNLRGWKEIANKIDELRGANVQENGEMVLRHCRLLVGMIKAPIDEIKALFAEQAEDEIDNKRKNEI